MESNSRPHESSEELTEEKKSLEDEVLSIMNGLETADFVDRAVEMRKLNIETNDDLWELVRVFVNKVTMEYEFEFLMACGKLSKIMSRVKVPPPPGSGLGENQNTFRMLMLTKLQQEYEEFKSLNIRDSEELRKNLEAVNLTEQPQVVNNTENSVEQMELKRLKFHGGIRFIAHLFILGSITENIVHSIIYDLLKAGDIQSFISVCIVIITAGHILDTETAKERMNQHFVHMAKIAEKQNTRIRSLLECVVNMRNGNWRIPHAELSHMKQTIEKMVEEFQQTTLASVQSQPHQTADEASSIQ